MAADGRLDLDRITAGFNLTKGQLAETAGLASDTLQKSARRDAPKTQARMTEVLEILSRLETWAGGRGQALAWYRAQPIAALDGRTAEALVKSGKAALVRDYLDHLALGGFA
ncbi:XRE family transcriptional regulator [Caulobacter sp. Root656]|nr:XRE family transcriptional regulator [Caulobacter sp. Root656]